MNTCMLLVACIVGVTNGATFYTSSQSTSFNGNNIYVGGYEIHVITEPTPKLIINNQEVNLTSAGGVQTGPNFTYYTNFTNYPGISVRFFNNGGFTLYYERDGNLSTFGTLSPEEQKQLDENLKNTFEHVNQQMAQVQQQVSNTMQSLTNMFNQPGWPFVNNNW